MNHSLFSPGVLCLCALACLSPAIAQDVTVATLPESVVTGPRLLLVQKTTQGVRWRELNSGLTGWNNWNAVTILGAHFDGFDRMALAGWNDQGVARYNAFEAVLGSQGEILVGEVSWNFASNPAAGVPALRAAPSTATGHFFFPVDAIGRVFDRSFSAFGTSVAALGNGLVYTPRELFRASPPLFRDMAGSGASTPGVMLGANSTSLRDAAFANWDRTTAVMHQHSSGSRTVALYSASNVINASVPDTRLDLGAPVGVMTQPPVLFIHDSVQPGPMNVFTVARDPSGRRRLFERSTSGNPTQIGGWSGWKNWEFPPGAPAAAGDDFELSVALVWREPGTNRLRVNLFGTRAGMLIERYWSGFGWLWGASRALPSPGLRVTDGAVVTRTGQWPRLSIFGVNPSGTPFECLFDWSRGDWFWQPLN